MNRAKNFINSTFEAFRKASSVAVIMMKKSIIERKRKSKFQHLGELTYALYKTNTIQNESLKDLVDDIDSINKNIRETSTELDSFVNNEIKN
ncbi:MAG: hypothetical protein V1647_03005 [Pseudomonadota bacterium]